MSSSVADLKAVGIMTTLVPVKQPGRIRINKPYVSTKNNDVITKSQQNYTHILQDSLYYCI